MADPELTRALDYILNRCDEAAIEVVAGAVVRRRRELALFGGAARLPDPGRWAKELSSRINLEGAIEGLTKSVRDYAVRIIKQEAPELSDEKIEELTRAWIPSPAKGGDAPDAGKDGGRLSRIPRDILAGMIDQFVSYSLNRMDSGEERSLRNELGPWPGRYWKTFPPVIRAVIRDFLSGNMPEDDFNSRIAAALSLQ